MSYQIHKGESCAKGIRGNVIQEIHDILERLRAKSLDPEAIHQSRRGLKRIRSLLRMIRHTVAPEFFRQEDQLLRELGKKLAPARDARVCAATLAKLRRAKRISAKNYPLYASKLEQAATDGRLNTKSVHTIRHTLIEMERRVADWPLAGLNTEDLVKGLEKIYRSGRKCWRKISPGTNDQIFHSWRKKVKHLESGLKLRKNSWTKRAKTKCKQVASLGERLGDAHDWTMLEARLSDAMESEGGAKRILHELNRCRAKSKKAAIRLGKKVFRDKARHFLKICFKKPHGKQMVTV